MLSVVVIVRAKYGFRQKWSADSKFAMVCTMRYMAFIWNTYFAQKPDACSLTPFYWKKNKNCGSSSSSDNTIFAGRWFLWGFMWLESGLFQRWNPKLCENKDSAVAAIFFIVISGTDISQSARISRISVTVPCVSRDVLVFNQTKFRQLLI
jgi:hypothetical protein